jgi:hypothetical protein
MPYYDDDGNELNPDNPLKSSGTPPALLLTIFGN